MTAPHEVDLWCVPLDAPPEVVDAHAAVLAPDERARAKAFRYDEHRRRFIVARGALRHLLGARVGVEPEAIVFAYGPTGKPGLAPHPPSAPSPRVAGRRTVQHFNVSHSEDVAVFAFCASEELGVDVELVRPIDDRDAISRRFFAAAERDELASLPESERTLGFYRCWTRKEAYIKAIGQGLAQPLDRFVVSVRGDRAALLEIDGDAEAASRWVVHSFVPAEGFVAALAMIAPANVSALRHADPAELLCG